MEVLENIWPVSVCATGKKRSSQQCTDHYFATSTASRCLRFAETVQERCRVFEGQHSAVRAEESAEVKCASVVEPRHHETVAYLSACGEG